MASEGTELSTAAPTSDPADAFSNLFTKRREIGLSVDRSERFSSAQLRDYDPTPQEFYDRLRARVGGRGQSPDGEVFVEIADALRESPQTPQLRATLYRALALVPGVQLLGDVRDRLGRAAIGVAFTEHTGLRQELLLDPETAEVLNERQVVAQRVQGIRWAVGTAVEDVVYTKRAVTDTTVRP